MRKNAPKKFLQNSRNFFASTKIDMYSEDVATAGRGRVNRKNGVEHAPPAWLPESRSDRLSLKSAGLNAPGVFKELGADSSW